MSEGTPQSNTHRWAMAIDLDRCTACQACVIACHAENNVPTVGPDQIAMGRALHWLRIERYWQGEYPDLQARYFPVLCQQCQHAPCEPVCPVFASVHSETQNINLQVYNRCIGTRYCGNNCPYLARVFNWFMPYIPEPLNEQLNPDVTVRYRGIMEKCTFCIQRIHAAEDTAAAEGRPLHDGDMVPACGQACPTDAIVFGDLLDENSVVSGMAKSKRAFTLLENLGTEPAVYYLKGGVSDAS